MDWIWLNKTYLVLNILRKNVKTWAITKAVVFISTGTGKSGDVFSHTLMVRMKMVKWRNWVLLLKRNEHRRRSSVNFGERHFCPKIYAWKINKRPKFYVILPGKLIKYPNFTYLPQKSFFPEFLRVDYCAGTTVQMYLRSLCMKLYVTFVMTIFMSPHSGSMYKIKVMNDELP